ncbi:hypothetical protein, partial [Streptomyces thermoalcalitolerans]
MTDETIYLTVNNHGRDRKLHVDRDCPRLNNVKAVVEYPRSSFPDNEVCKYCGGGDLSRDGGSKALNQKLME